MVVSFALLPASVIQTVQVPSRSLVSALKDVPVATGLGSYGGMERLHYLLERVWERPDEELSINFLKVHICPVHLSFAGCACCGL